MFEPGTKVQLTQFYRDNYPLWKPSIGTVIEVTGSRQYPIEALSKEERGLYAAKFGKQSVYTLTSMIVEFDGEKHLVSDLGVEPV